MKRRIILGSLLVVGALSIAVAAQQQQQPKTLEVTKLKDNLYVLKALTNGRGGNASVFLTAARVRHAADIFAGKNIPLLDANNGGSAVEIANSLEKAANSLNGKYDTIVTGHSSEMTPADLRQYIQFNREFVSDVQTAMKAGK